MGDQMVLMLLLLHLLLREIDQQGLLRRLLGLAVVEVAPRQRLELLLGTQSHWQKSFGR